jgi:hypothetical protein
MVHAAHMGGIWFGAKLVVSLSPERFSMSRLRIGGVALLLFASSLALSPASPASAALSGSEFTLGEVEEFSETGKVITYRAPDGGLRHRDLTTGTDIAQGASFVRGDGRYQVTVTYKKDGGTDPKDAVIVDDATTAGREVLDVGNFLGGYAGYQFLNVEDVASNGKFVLFRIGIVAGDGAEVSRLFAWDIIGKVTVELDAGRRRCVTRCIPIPHQRRRETRRIHLRQLRRRMRREGAGHGLSVHPVLDHDRRRVTRQDQRQ